MINIYELLIIESKDINSKIANIINAIKKAIIRVKLFAICYLTRYINLRFVISFVHSVINPIYIKYYCRSSGNNNRVYIR